MPLSPYQPEPFSAPGDPPGSPQWAFTKFQRADYKIELDLEPIGSDPVRGAASVEATIVFDVDSAAQVLPVIEFTASLASNMSIRLDGRSVGFRVVSPDSKPDGPKFLGIESLVSSAGNPFTLVIRYETQLRVHGEGVDAASFMRRSDPGVYWHFRMSDERPNSKHGVADDSNFLGRYLPTNLEYDQHDRSIEFTFDEIDGAAKNLDLFTNGQIQGASGKPLQVAPKIPHTISFPAHFTSSSIFFYLGDGSAIKQHPITVNLSRPGPIPNDPPETQTLEVTVIGHLKRVGRGGYKWDPKEYQVDVEQAAEALFDDFGPFKHDRLLLLAGRQGMEYANAAEVADGNVLHEMFHLFVGRYLVPVDGPSGWWDEALAHWYVSGKNAYPQPPDTPASIGSGPRYRRWTSRDARTIGAMLMGHIHHLLVGAGRPRGMIDFLADQLAGASNIVQLDTDDLRNRLETFSGLSFDNLFDRYVRR